MTDPTPAERASRKRLINLGEGIGVVAVLISGLGLWNSWRDGGETAPAPTTVVERQSSVPLALRGRIEDGGKTLAISAVEPGHALDSLTLTIDGKAPIAVGGDGRVAASALEAAVPRAAKGERDGVIAVRIAARYVEAGVDRRGGGPYRLTYRWVSGGLFGGNSLRLTGLSRG